MITITEASKLVGRTRQTIFRAIKAGKLSSKKNKAGVNMIDPAELFRVYDTVTQESIDTSDTKPLEQKNNIHNATDQSVLIAQLQSQLEAQEVVINEKNEQIDDWKRRLDKSELERREAQERFNNLLTDQSKKNENAKSKKGLLGRLFG